MLSVIFQLTPSPEHGQNVLTVEEAIAGTTLEPSRGVGPDVQASLTARADAGITLLADPKRSSRGFEFNFEHGHYAVCVFSPSTPTDWQIALEFIRDLAVRLDATITDDQERTHTVESVLDVPYMDNIMFGIQGIHGQAQRSGLAVMDGFRRPLHLSPEMTGAILDSSDPAAQFERRFLAVQNIAAVDARPNLTEYQGACFVEYNILEGGPMVLPGRSPFPTPQLRHQLQGRPVMEWLAVLYYDAESQGGKPELADGIPYHEFLERLPESKRRPIDGYAMYMEPLTRDEITAIVGR